MIFYDSLLRFREISKSYARIAIPISQPCDDFVGENSDDTYATTRVISNILHLRDKKFGM